MAKSLRSKWRRKCRAAKRVRYGEKELERLKKTISNDPHRKPEDVEQMIVDKVEQVATMVSKEDIVQSQSVEVDEDGADVEMQVEGGSERFNRRTLRDKKGQFPEWMHQRRRHRNATTAKNKSKKGKNKKKVKRGKIGRR